MKYFFVLGSNPTLSVAELSATFKLTDKNRYSWSVPNVFVLETETFDAKELIKNVGGIIKIGKIESESDYNEKRVAKKIEDFFSGLAPIGKFLFGISHYGKKKINTKVVGMETKKYLKEEGINCRWVTSREPVLSSVIVEQNHLIDKGMEIVLIDDNNKLLLGKTLAVQPFKELSRRDFGRPGRDDQSGMLPPKLAQIMINLSGAGKTETILDPFCGSGTVLTEAMLMGYKNLIGSDISQKAIDNTKRNIEWTKNNFKFSILNFKLINANATEIAKKIAADSVDAIVTEPYLGPQRGWHDLKQTARDLEKLYSESLNDFKKILKPGGKIVMLLPVFMPHGGASADKPPINVSPGINDYKLLSPLPESILKNKNTKLTNRGTLLYGREGQKVWREIIIIQKK